MLNPGAIQYTGPACGAKKVGSPRLARAREKKSGA